MVGREKALMGRRVLGIFKGQQRVARQIKQKEVTDEVPVKLEEIRPGHVVYSYMPHIII